LPARAASTAAFSDSTLVWNAISSIVRMMRAMPSLEPRIASMPRTIASSMRVDSSVCCASSLISSRALFERSALPDASDAI
jgi:hypothetical protein